MPSLLRVKYAYQTWGLFPVAIAILIAGAAPLIADDSLVLHYTFDEDTGETARDHGPHSNHGTIVSGQHLAEVDGQRGVLRFNGKDSIINCPKTESLQFSGDMTFELRVRRNSPEMALWSVIFGDENDFSFYDCNYHSLLLWYTGRHPDNKIETTLVTVDRNILSNRWSHIAVVIEYPRCRFYHNGELVRDGYMPLVGIMNNNNNPFMIGEELPIDLDEFRLYRRALSAAEIAAHAKGKDLVTAPSQELTVEPHWYDNTLDLRLACKGANHSEHTAELTLLDGGGRQLVQPRSVKLAEAFPGSGRYVGTARYDLDKLAGRSIDAVAKISSADGQTLTTIYRHAALAKPGWVNSLEGHTNKVPAPWTAVQSRQISGDAVAINVWGRRYVLGTTAFVQQIEATGAEILAAPITLRGRANNKDLAWEKAHVHLGDHSNTGATVQQTQRSDAVELSVATTIEYDGYAVFEATLRARRDLSLDELMLDVPLLTKYAQLCTGDRVLPPDPEISMAEFYGGQIRGDLAFRFSPSIWLGNERRGLLWQVESDEHWHYADPQRVIEILPRGDTTHLRARLIDVPVQLKRGDMLHYKFALQATPTKKVLRDSWDLRILRAEPYGLDLGLPDRKVDGRPEIEHLAEIGMRHMFTTGCDMWPYPLPVGDRYSRMLHRLNDQMHAAGLKIYNYQIHQRYPVGAPEFDIYGQQMSMRPMRQYIPGNNPPGSPRPGPVGVEYGANSQGTVMFCAKSAALRDAVADSIARRLDLYGDDGIYLDGTSQTPPCQNISHGCGYRAADGTMHKTYPVFAVRELMRRIYNVVKQRRPEGVVDVHASFGVNPAGLAYADMFWTGEQWHHFRGNNKPPHVSTHMTLDKFRAEFMGVPIGVAAETLSYRLGSPMKVAAVSLLHDTPSRPSTRDRFKLRKHGVPIGTNPKEVSDQSQDTLDSPKRDDFPTSHSSKMVELWQMRDRFDAENARKLFYWENQEYVTVSPDNCWTTLLQHPHNGVLALISNLNTDSRLVTLQFHLDRLGLDNRALEAVNALTDEPIDVTASGNISVPLDTEQWMYVWLRARNPSDGN